MKTALQIAMDRAEALEPIPPITDPMGRSWRQPRRQEIEIDDTCALMSAASFGQLVEYSGTLPSGVYEGKMWRRLNGKYDQAFLRNGGKPVWLLVWFGKSDKPGHVSINTRRILLTDGELPA